jgi:hypothetical protein
MMDDPEAGGHRPFGGPQCLARSVRNTEQTSCQMPDARMDAGCRPVHHRTGGRNIPNSDNKFLIVGILLTKGILNIAAGPANCPLAAYLHATVGGGKRAGAIPTYPATLTLIALLQQLIQGLRPGGQLGLHSFDPASRLGR